jgi:tetratricopeptide (TPR) repeat protein
MVPLYLSLEPDVVLIYTGHNEFYGPEGVGISWLERTIPGLTPWKYRARRLPIVLATQHIIARLAGTQSGGEQSLMRQVSGGAEITLAGPEAERVFRQFEENLREIVRAFRKQGIPVILGDVSSSLMFPPFAPRPEAPHDTLRLAIASGRSGVAEPVIERALDRDPANAYYLYWRGRLSLAAGDSSTALHYLERARDHDLLKFRAPGRINSIVHQVAREESLPLLAIDSLMRARSPHGITDTTLFCEHLHPTFAGYDLIARSFVRAIVRQHIAKSPHPPTASLLPFHPDSLSVPWIDLGYGAWSLRNLMSRWPFAGMPLRHDVLESCEDWELQIVKDIYGGKVGWTDACLQYADKARRNKKDGAVVTALSALVEEYPWVYLFRYGYATALESVGKTPEAIDQYRRALALKPDFLDARVDFALLLLQEGAYDEARQYLNPILALPGDAASTAVLRARALYGLAFVAANRDSIASALTLLDESLRLAPGYQAALELRSQIAGRGR